MRVCRNGTCFISLDRPIEIELEAILLLATKMINRHRHDHVINRLARISLHDLHNGARRLCSDDDRRRETYDRRYADNHGEDSGAAQQPGSGAGTERDSNHDRKEDRDGDTALQADPRGSAPDPRTQSAPPQVMI